MDQHITDVLAKVASENARPPGALGRPADTSVELPEDAVWLRSVRTRHGITQTMMAHAMGVAQPYLSALERGKIKLSPRLRRIALRIDVLIGD